MTDAVAGTLLRDVQALRSRAPRDQLRGLRRLESDFSRTNDPTGRMRLALALGLLDPPLQDGSRARALAVKYLSAMPGGYHRHLAQIVLAILAEGQRQSQVRQRLEARLAQADRQRRLLARQLEALKEIERAIDARDEAQGGAR